MLIVLSSATSAERLRKLLGAEKIPSEVTQTPKSISEGGCGYSLNVADARADEAVKKARELHIGIKGVYTEESTGKKLTYRRKG